MLTILIITGIVIFGAGAVFAISYFDELPMFDRRHKWWPWDYRNCPKRRDEMEG